MVIAVAWLPGGVIRHAARPRRAHPLDARFWWWLSVSGLASLTPRPVRRRLARWLDNPAMLDQEMMDLMWAGIRSYRMERKFPALLTDGQLAAVTVPALLVTGARSALITPPRPANAPRTCPAPSSRSFPAATAASTAPTPSTPRWSSSCSPSARRLSRG